MSDVEKVRRGSALLIVGVLGYVLGAFVNAHAAAEGSLSNVVLALMLGGLVAAAVGLVWLVTGLWRGGKAKV